MIDAAARAIAQMFSQPFRAVLLKAIGLALLLIILIGVGLHEMFQWLAQTAEAWADGALGPSVRIPLDLLAKALSLAAVFGIIAGSIFMMPAVTALVASFFVDDIAAEVERVHYPAEPQGLALPFSRAILEGIKTALLAVMVYLIALPFMLFAGLGLLIFFFASAYLLGREYFLLAAMRFHPPEAARRLRSLHQGTIFVAGMFISAFVMIPVVNLATPLFGMAFMVHIHKRISAMAPVEAVRAGW